MRLLSKLTICTVTCVSMVISTSLFADGNDKSPETIVTCGFGALPGVIVADNGGLYSVLGRSTLPSVNTDQCDFGTEVDLCSTCITSLENQGCKVKETVTDQFADVEEFRSAGMVTYLLSCISP